MSLKKYFNLKWLSPLVILWLLALIIFIIDVIIGTPDHIGIIIGYVALILGPVISLLMVLFMNPNFNNNRKSKSILPTQKDLTFFTGLHAANLCVFSLIASILGPILGPLLGIDN